MTKPNEPQGGPLVRYGARLIDHGYQIVPILVGKKAPPFDGWQHIRATRQILTEWINNGHKWSGVGVLTKHTPAIDIDVRDEEVSVLCQRWIEENIDFAPVRIGMAPKRLMVFKTSKPFKKMYSAKYQDEWGQTHQIEVLGEGQQFVAFHKHPDTGKPYYWPGNGDLLEIPSDDLPELEAGQIEALFDFFETEAKKREWVVVKQSRNLNVDNGDNPFVEDTSTAEISDEALYQCLMLVPGSEDYDLWKDIGMALYHQYKGGEKGLQMWHEWSELASNYDEEALNRKWKSFDINGKGKAPITARLIIKKSRDAIADSTQQLQRDLDIQFRTAADLKDWAAAAEATQHAEIDAIGRSALAQIAKERRDAITGTKTSLVEIKKVLRYVPPHREEAPPWCENWVYDTSDDKFYHLEWKIACTKQGFDAMFNRRALTKRDKLDGRATPSSPASELALSTYKMKSVQGRRYQPGADPLIPLEDDKTRYYANTYPEHEIPEIPAKLMPIDEANVNRVDRHIAHLLEREDEQAMLLDWLSWVVQHPGQHVNYAVVLQGVPGDGKTFFAEMMRAVMGPTNVSMLNAHILHSDFSDWAEGQCLACIEEIRLINDSNKYEVINKVKPFITNNVIEIHPKGKPPRNVINTTSYLLFTNYRDALPLDTTDRRYLTLFSKWQRKEDIERFTREHPEYYIRLYRAIEQSPGAIRQWLLNHQQSPNFRAKGNAPDTEAKRFMIRQAQPEFIQHLDDLIEEGNVAEIGTELLDVTFLADYMTTIGMDFPAPKAMTAMLQRSGYEMVGRMVMPDGQRHRFWSQKPEQFRRGSSVKTEAIHAYLDRRRREIKDDEL